MHTIITYKRMADSGTSIFDCFVWKSCNFLSSKSVSHVIIRLQTVRNETSACKIPIIDHGDLLLTTCTFVIDLTIINHHLCLSTQSL